jgi:hypothetical protein
LPVLLGVPGRLAEQKGFSAGHLPGCCPQW